MSDKPSFFVELKRRNVYKVAVAYAVVSWLLLQAASIFLPAFNAPSWVMKIFIIVVILGFPVALIFLGLSRSLRKESNSIYDSVRNEPRFQAILKKIGLE
jgi:hypothetical protein